MFNIAPFLIYVCVMAITPGPNNIMSMLNGAKFGYKKSVKFLIGISTGFFIILIISSYLSLILINSLPKFKYIIGILGAIYMTYLAVKIMTNSNKKNTQNHLYNSFWAAVLLQFVNAKGILYSITVVTTFIAPYYHSAVAFLLFSLSLSIFGFLISSLWALFGVFFERLFEKQGHVLNIVMGLLLIYCAISVSGIMEILFNK